MKYGVLLGRFQPFHIGHEAIVHEIIADGLRPIVLIGSADVLDTRNPYTANDRDSMIKRVFNVDTAWIDDKDTYDAWLEEVEAWLSSLSVDKSNCVWYINNKEQDKHDFVFKEKEYSNTFWTHILLDEGYNVKQATYSNKLGLNINATDIRNNLEGNKHFLDSRVYNYIKSLT